MSKKLYSFHWDCRRMGDLTGVFIAEENEVKALIGKEVYFGEVLGKHSEIEGTIDAEDFTVRSDDQDLIAKLMGVFDGGHIDGINPFHFLEDELED